MVSQPRTRFSYHCRLMCLTAFVGLLLFSRPAVAAVAWGDFDGNGSQDLAVGCPDADFVNPDTGETIAEAGLVHVIYADANGRLDASNEQTLMRSPVENQHFGNALAVGDFNGDDVEDLAVGRLKTGTFLARSSVSVFHGLQGSGLSFVSSIDASIFETQSGQFGAALAAGDFDGDGFDDLAIGNPGAPVSFLENSGMIEVKRGSELGLIGIQSRWSQDSDNIEGIAEVGDIFGASLAAGNFNGDVNFVDDEPIPVDDLAIGVPGEDFSGANSGVVNVIYGVPDVGLTAAANQIWSQDGLFGDSGSDIEGATEDGDFFGFALATGNFNGDARIVNGQSIPIDDLAVGVPFEDIGGLFGDDNAGAVNVIYGSPGKLQDDGNQLLTQGGVTGQGDLFGSTEDGDRFGFVLAAGNLKGPRLGTSVRIDDLAIGVPGENVEGVVDAGAVNVVFGALNEGLTSDDNEIWTLRVPPVTGQPGSSTGLKGGADQDDEFGFALAAGNVGGVRALAVGVPGDGDFGAVNVIYEGNPSGLDNSGNQQWLCQSEGLVQTLQFANGPFEFPVVVDGGFGSDGDEWSPVSPAGFIAANGVVTATTGTDPLANTLSYTALAPLNNNNGAVAFCSMTAFALRTLQTCQAGDFIADINFPIQLNHSTRRHGNNGHVATVQFRGVAADSPTCVVDVQVDLNGDSRPDLSADDLGIAAAARFGTSPLSLRQGHLLIEMCVPQTLLPPSPGFVTARLATNEQPLLASSTFVERTNSLVIATTNQVVERVVAINVKPTGKHNSINLKSNGVLPVAILTTPSFDATTVGPRTVRLANPEDLSKTARPLRYARKDVDRDGDKDLLLHVRIRELVNMGVLTKNSEAVVLIGRRGAETLAGSDSVRIVPGKSR